MNVHTTIYLVSKNDDWNSLDLQRIKTKNYKFTFLKSMKELAAIPISTFHILFVDIDVIDQTNLSLIEELCDFNIQVIILVNSFEQVFEIQHIIGKNNLIILTKPLQFSNFEYIVNSYNLANQHMVASTSTLTDLTDIDADILNSPELQNAFFQILMNNTTDAIYFKNIDSRFVCINQNMLHVLGVNSFGTVIGKTDYDFFTHEKAVEALQDEQEILSNKKALINKVEKDTRNDGWTRWVSTTKIPIINVRGEAVGLFGISRDITTQIHFQEQLFFNEKKYKTLFEKSNIGILILNSSLEITDLNATSLNILNNTKNKLLGIHVLDSLHCNEKKQAKIISALTTKKEIQNRIVKFTTVSGLKKYVSLSITKLEHQINNNMSYIAFFSDETTYFINEKLLSEKNLKLEETFQRLKQTQSSLIHQEKLASIGQLAAGVAHEINNPLAFVSSNFNTLENYTKDLLTHIDKLENLLTEAKASFSNPEFQETIDKTTNNPDISFIKEDIQDLFVESKDGFHRIRNIVQSLRDFSRIDASAKQEQFDFNKSIKDTLTVAKNEIKYAANVVLNLQSVPLIQCNASDINQVLLNIIVNAAQAIKDQQREGELGTINISTLADDEHVICQVNDDGPGIPDEIQNKIFDPFFTTKKVGKGTGIGLSISYDIIVNKHHGQLYVESQAGEGTTFIIKLPINDKQI